MYVSPVALKPRLPMSLQRAANADRSEAVMSSGSWRALILLKVNGDQRASTKKGACRTEQS